MTLHAGLTRASCVAGDQPLPQSTDIRNVRQLSILSAERDGPLIAEILGVLDSWTPLHLGTSMVIKGIPRFHPCLPPMRGFASDLWCDDSRLTRGGKTAPACCPVARSKKGRPPATGPQVSSPALAHRRVRDRLDPSREGAC